MGARRENDVSNLGEGFALEVTLQSRCHLGVRVDNLEGMQIWKKSQATRERRQYCKRGTTSQRHSRYSDVLLLA